MPGEIPQAQQSFTYAIDEREYPQQYLSAQNDQKPPKQLAVRFGNRIPEGFPAKQND